MHGHSGRRFGGPVMLAVLLMPMVVSAQADGAAYETFLGNWESMPTPGAPGVTMTWEDRGGGIVFVSTADSATEAGPIEVFAFRQDGKDYPYAFRGGDVTSTIASLGVDPRTIDVTYKIGGTRAASSRWTVSEDGATMTIGRPDGSTWTLARRGDARAAAPGDFRTGYKRYIGVWEAVRYADGSDTGSVVWEDRGENFVVATVRNRDGQVTMRYSLKYDGKPYPSIGRQGGVGTITSVFVDEYRTDWSLFRADGRRSGTGSRIVDPDGRRMVVPGSGGGNNDLIWHRQGDAPTDGILAP